MTHKIDMEPLFKVHSFITWGGFPDEFTPLAFHSINPNLLFLNMSRKFVVLDMNKDELTLVCDHQLQVHDPGNGFSFNWARPFEEPVWMLTLPCLPLLFRPNISRHARYMITCYKTYICQHYVIYAFYYVILDGWWSVLLDRYERIHNWFLSVSDFLEVIMCYAISPYLNPNVWFLFYYKKD